MSYQDFERRIPQAFRDFVKDEFEQRGGVLVPGGDGIYLTCGFSKVATLTFDEAAALTDQDKQTLRDAFAAHC